jgi:hypothetical protein
MCLEKEGLGTDGKKQKSRAVRCLPQEKMVVSNLSPPVL